MTDAIVEIRDYTIDLEWFDAYKTWADEVAAPWLRANLNVIDFWMDCGIEPELKGSNPVPPANGQANVCWIIRWDSIEDRQANFGRIMGSDGWKEVWASHPNPDSYLAMNVRFMKAAG